MNYVRDVLCPVCKAVIDTLATEHEDLPTGAVTAMLFQGSRRRHAHESPTCVGVAGWGRGWDYGEPRDSAAPVESTDRLLLALAKQMADLLWPDGKRNMPFVFRAWNGDERVGAALGLLKHIREGHVRGLTIDMNPGFWGRACARQTREIAVLKAEVKRLEATSIAIDAERWRALMRCARIRTLGSAGMANPKDNHYQHLGLELTSLYPTETDEAAKKLDEERASSADILTDFADNIREHF